MPSGPTRMRGSRLRTDPRHSKTTGTSHEPPSALRDCSVMSNWTRSPLLACTVLASVALVAGCGGSDGGGSGNAASSGSTETTSSSGGSGASFAECMKQHGVEVPSAGFGGAGQRPAPQGQQQSGQGTPPRLPDGTDPSKFQDAMQACRSLAPQVTLGGGQQSASFITCMKEHGVDVGEGLAPGTLPDGVSQEALQVGLQACRTPASGPSGTASSGGEANTRFARFAACMKRNGVTLPGAGSSTVQVDPASAAYKTAERQCTTLLQPSDTTDAP